MFGGGFPFGGMGGMPGMGGMGGMPERKKSDNQKYYDLLGVDRNATETDLKKAHRKLAMKHHPDKGGDPTTFQEINAAYDVLKDPKKREVYDQYGEDAIKEGMHEAGGMGGGGMADIFEMMGGGGRRGPRKGEPVVYKLKCTLEEIYNGSSRKLSLQRNLKCDSCNATGTKSGRSATCRTCNGAGATIQLRQLGPGMVQQVQARCSECAGSGESAPPGDRCESCNGKKLKPEKKVFEVNIEQGMKNGHKIVLRGEAGYSSPGVEPGDVIFVVDQKEHPDFTRKGNDLFLQKQITLAEALCGFKFTVKQLDGRELLVTSNPGDIIRPGDWKAIFDEGMPTHTRQFDKGSLYINFSVKFPETLAGEQLNALSNIFPRGPDPTADLDLTSEDVEECTMVTVDMEQESARRQAQQRETSAYDEDDEDDSGGGQRVQCAQQ